jgi:hypothetical protein
MMNKFRADCGPEGQSREAGCRFGKGVSENWWIGGVKGMRKLRRQLLMIGLAGIFLVVVFPLAADDGGDWEFDIEPYGLMANIEGDGGMGRMGDYPIDVDFGRILETLDATLMLHFESRHSSGWGFWLDYGFMDLRQDTTGPVGLLVADSRVRQGILEAFALYRKPAGKATLDWVGGVRWWDNDFGVTISSEGLDPVRRKRSEGWVDPVFGLRWTYPLGRKWDLRLRGDLAGFGITSDLSGTLSARFLWTLSRVVQLDFGYKALWVDYDTGHRGDTDYFLYDTVTHGPLVGLNFSF